MGTLVEFSKTGCFKGTHFKSDLGKKVMYDKQLFIIGC